MHAAVPPQVNDFSADAIISQLLLLDAQDPTKVSSGGWPHTHPHAHHVRTRWTRTHACPWAADPKACKGQPNPACLIAACGDLCRGAGAASLAVRGLAPPRPQHRPPPPAWLAPLQDIKMFINSPGGSVTAGMGIYDAMMMCRADVQVPGRAGRRSAVCSVRPLLSMRACAR